MRRARAYIILRRAPASSTLFRKRASERARAHDMTSRINCAQKHTHNLIFSLSQGSARSLKSLFTFSLALYCFLHARWSCRVLYAGDDSHTHTNEHCVTLIDVLLFLRELPNFIIFYFLSAPLAHVKLIWALVTKSRRKYDLLLSFVCRRRQTKPEVAAGVMRRAACKQVHGHAGARIVTNNRTRAFKLCARFNYGP